MTPAAVHPGVREAIGPLGEHYRQRRVLVTGGLGFIGSAVVHQLAEAAADVVNLDAGTYAAHPDNLQGLAPAARVRTVRVDVADSKAVAAAWRAHEPDVVLHLAAESHVDRSILDSAQFLRTNVEGTRVLLEQLRTAEPAPACFVQVGTDEVYGDVAPDAAPVDERAGLRPSSPYSASKAAADLLALSYVRTYGVPLVVTRGSNTYGPRQFPEKLIPHMLMRAMHGEPLPVYGDGQQRRDWLFVDDHACAILRVPPAFPQFRRSPADAWAWAVLNLGSGHDIPNLELLERLLRALVQLRPPGVTTSFDELWQRVDHVRDRPGHDRRYAMETRRAREALGWSPLVELDAGLDYTVRWYLENRPWLDRIRQGHQDYLGRVYGPAAPG